MADVKHNARSQAGTQTCKVLVPVYRPLSDFEAAIVRHNLSLLSDHQAALFGPSSKRDILVSTAETLIKDTGANITVECFDDHYFKDVYGYSQLLLAHEFFERFKDVTHVLICQTDALILSGNLQQWLETDYSYIGAPIFKGFAKPVMPPKFTNMLNGGLSLRNVGDAQRALKKVSFLKKSKWSRVFKKLGLLLISNMVLRLIGRKSFVIINENVHEDVIWTGQIRACVPGFTTPGLDTALRFAFEVLPRYLYEKNGRELPFGCHAFEAHDPDFWHEHFPKWTLEYRSDR
ncbi:DUF5672 family protein [Roseovarius sp. EL26]|uniref:DUF5672 family protein n=1 Tax=Roseovarius sp. EL26 TaxID=2126672 RepID=UPI000EA14817|nr:DUF5672 family protein [Roseovarius sp. EL26]